MNIDRIFNELLAFFVMSAAFLLVVGGAIFLFKHGHEIPNYRVFQGIPIEYPGIDGALKMAVEGRSGGYIQLGVIILMTVPLLHVFFFVFEYLLQREYVYAFFAFFALFVLTMSLFQKW